MVRPNRSRAASISVVMSGMLLACPQPQPDRPHVRELDPALAGRDEGAASRAVGAPEAPEVQLDSTYELPPPEVVKIVDAPPTPRVDMAPDGTRMALLSYPALPDIGLVARPMLRLAGTRIQPDRSERHRTRYYDGLKIVEVGGGTDSSPPPGAEIEVPGHRLIDLRWSPDGTHIAMSTWAEEGVELWLVDVATRTPRRLGEFHVNDSIGANFVWLPGSKGLVVRTIPPGRGPDPKAPAVPPGPTVMESTGREAQNRTYQDLLQDRVDEALFEHHFTSRVVRVDLGGQVTSLGTAGIYTELDPSPDGKYLLVERLEGPWSYTVPWWRFGHSTELWGLEETAQGNGEPPIVLSRSPLADEIPIEGVRKGPRSHEWQPTEGATLVWTEALDEGDPRKEVEFRDRVRRLAAPFDGEPQLVAKTEERFSGIAWLETRGQFLITDYDRDRRWIRTRLLDLADPAVDRLIFDRSVHDRYGDPGRPIYEARDDGTYVVRVHEGSIYLSGSGASERGDRPFVDRMKLDGNLDKTRLFEAPEDAYARFVDFVGDTEQLVFQRESPLDPPNYFVDDPAGGVERPLTDFPHPHPELSGIEKRLLTYKRKDGVALSGTLYLPPGYAPGQKLPLVIWAYPREYRSKDTAGQVRAAPTRFTRLRSTSPLMFLTQGYAVLDGAAMPIVGDPETMNDTFLRQLVQSAQAAIDAVVAEGVADRDRVGIAGHSYGAFMAANLLAHSDLFRAGIARSGAYNRSLTPFGFQSERRTLWEATPTYIEVSPLFSAHEIDEPLLMIHGDVDNNSGTFPIQSKRLFHALQGLGGTVRLVLLPHESHGYRARESVLHVLAESFRWFDTHVKNPPAPDADPELGSPEVKSG